MRGVAGPLGRGLTAYVRLIVHVRAAPTTAKEIEDRCGASPGTARRMSRRLLDAQILSVFDWRTVDKGPRVRVLGFGPPPPGVPQRPSRRRDGGASRHCGAIETCKRGRQADQFIRLWRQLASEPGSMDVLALASGLHEHTIYAVLREMREHNLARVAKWHCGPGERTPLWRLGAAPDAKRPPPLPSTVISRTYREKQRGLLRHATSVRAIASNASVFHYAQSCAA